MLFTILICFFALSYVIMPRLLREVKRERLSITLDPRLITWLQENTGSSVDNKKFRTISNAIEQGLILLKEKTESEK